MSIVPFSIFQLFLIQYKQKSIMTHFFFLKGELLQMLFCNSLKMIMRKAQLVTSYIHIQWIYSVVLSSGESILKFL